MKVTLGKYKRHASFWSLYGWNEEFIGEKENDELIAYLSSTWLQKLLDLWNKFNTRHIAVKIHDYDVWNMDGTLAIITLPMLKLLKSKKHGSPLVNDLDVPEYLRSTAAPSVENEWDTDDNFHLRWDWVINEMIWTFEQLQPDCDWESQYTSGEFDWDFDESNIMQTGKNHTYQIDMVSRQKHQDRISNGLRLFGKYYQNLWD